MASFLLALALIAVSSSATAAPVLSTFNLVASPGFQLLPQTFQATPGIIAASQTDESLFPHPAVVQNAAAEAQLAPELLNPFYKNPAIAAGLAKESWFINKEFPVHHREAEKISRSEIYKIVNRIQEVSS